MNEPSLGAATSLRGRTWTKPASNLAMGVRALEGIDGTLSGSAIQKCSSTRTEVKPISRPTSVA
jgi:hypothetical protein